MNYHKKMQEILANLNVRPTILFHTCCAPCSTICLHLLKDYFDITVLYYNPNIEPEEEYLKRKEEQKRLLKKLNINFLDCDYDGDAFKKMAKGLENEPERGKRCYKCYELRLSYTARKAKELGFDYFGTSLTVSPYKVSNWVNEIGSILSDKYNVKFLYSDFKKENGYLKSIEYSKEYNLYRQNYCGCKYSKPE